MDNVIECLDSHDTFNGGCSGEVRYRPSMSPSGKQFPRCDKHFDKRYARQIQISQRYGTPVWY